MPILAVDALLPMRLEPAKRNRGLRDLAAKYDRPSASPSHHAGRASEKLVRKLFLRIAQGLIEGLQRLVGRPQGIEPRCHELLLRIEAIGQALLACAAIAQQRCAAARHALGIVTDRIA